MTKAAALAALNDSKAVTHPLLEVFGFDSFISLNNNSSKTQEECEAEFNDAFSDEAFNEGWELHVEAHHHG